MSKLALISAFFLLSVSTCHAQDAKSDGTGTNTASPADTSASGKPGHEHGREHGREHGGRGQGREHERAPGKKAVLDLTSLSDKQKSQINAIYDGDKAQWESFQKQMRELHESEWSKVKALLTPDQVQELQSEKHRGNRERRRGAAEAKPAGDSK